jgi:hypothetical protein
MCIRKCLLLLKHPIRFKRSKLCYLKHFRCYKRGTIERLSREIFLKVLYFMLDVKRIYLVWNYYRLVQDIQQYKSWKLVSWIIYPVLTCSFFSGCTYWTKRNSSTSRFSTVSQFESSPSPVVPHILLLKSVEPALFPSGVDFDYMYYFI